MTVLYFKSFLFFLSGNYISRGSRRLSSCRVYFVLQEEEEGRLFFHQYRLHKKVWFTGFSNISLSARIIPGGLKDRLERHPNPLYRLGPSSRAVFPTTEH
ncbi:Hypothetical predicted protein [Podarcis lilfordi]|uniref:Uncharacterized protein n=1 Tax=Podarcis lilfordi TaxID=74358 RepID=A0AA35PN98_9SAUR|nr:Hypothetical predicted protein [Podarcis lilfordi]